MPCSKIGVIYYNTKLGLWRKDVQSNICFSVGKQTQVPDINTKQYLCSLSNDAPIFYLLQLILITMKYK